MSLNLSLPLNQRIIVNRTLNLNSVKVIGFDMDYTLVLYNEDQMEKVAFAGAVEHLLNDFSYPDDVRRFSYSSEKIARGLVIDKRLGNLIKINRFGYVKAALHGAHFYTREEVRETYANEIVRFSNARYEMFHTMFSLALGSLFCQLVELGIPGKTYEELYAHATECVDRVHRRGYLKTRILQDPGTYIRVDPSYAETLKMLRQFGKKLVLITNSDWQFGKEMMAWSFDRFLEPGQKWADLFDLVVMESGKPEFFTRKNKFFEVIPDSGHLKNVRGGIKQGGIYQGGNATEVESLFEVTPSRILYVGDHIYSDVYQSKRSCAWRTMLVITELEQEFSATIAGKSALTQIGRLMTKKESLELEMDRVRKAQKSVVTPEERAQCDGEDERLREMIDGIDGELSGYIQSYDSHFHPYWGELLWAGNDQSIFGMSIERYACTVTSRISNLLNYSPVHYFRPPVKNPLFFRSADEL